MMVTVPGLAFASARSFLMSVKRLSERVTVKNGQIYLDGDVVHGMLQEQILDFLNADEDFAPLVEAARVVGVGHGRRPMQPHCGRDRPLATPTAATAARTTAGSG